MSCVFTCKGTRSIKVIISANYRLGVFGFWFHPAFDPSYPEVNKDKIQSGNQGLLDQQMAMRWTREHVKKFGGDKDKVTIGGMSAGGQSIQGNNFRLTNHKLCCITYNFI